MAELVASISGITKPRAEGRTAAHLCLLSALSNMSNLWESCAFRELNLVPAKINGIFFPIQLPCLWFLPVLILFIRGKKKFSCGF